MTLKAPVRYFGGKGGMVTKLLRYFPDPSLYDTYIDAYGGAGTVLLAKPLTKVELYNDLNRNVYSLYKVLTDNTLFDDFRRRAELALYDESTSQEYRRALRTNELTILERAFQFWYVARTKRGGSGGGFIVNASVRRRMSKSTSDFLSSVEGLLPLHQRLSSVIVRNCDALDLIPQFDRHRCLIYLDPPYHHSTRTKARYETDADDAHHAQLIGVLNNVRHAYVVLSGYDNDVYDALTGFDKHHFKVKTVSSTNVPKVKTETVWRNFAASQMSMFEAQP